MTAKKLTAAEQLAHPCAACGAAAGEKCRNYLGKGKAPCPERGCAAAPAAKECPKCLAPVGEYVARLRLRPLDADQMICMGPKDPGAKWWEAVTRFWNVADAPTPGHWVAPELIALAAPGCGQGPEVPVCGYCRREAERCAQPSLFGDEPEGGAE